jgi:hypothetical protein
MKFKAKWSHLRRNSYQPFCPENTSAIQNALYIYIYIYMENRLTVTILLERDLISTYSLEVV